MLQMAGVLTRMVEAGGAPPVLCVQMASCVRIYLAVFTCRCVHNAPATCEHMNNDSSAIQACTQRCHLLAKHSRGNCASAVVRLVHGRTDDLPSNPTTLTTEIHQEGRMCRVRLSQQLVILMRMAGCHALAAGAVHAEMALILMMRARLDLLEGQQGRQYIHSIHKPIAWMLWTHGRQATLTPGVIEHLAHGVAVALPLGRVSKMSNVDMEAG